MAASGASIVIKRVAALNRGGALAMPLRYSEVKSVLEGAGEEKALQILAELEAEASSITDPVEFVRAAAAGNLGAGKTRKAAGSNVRSTEDGVTAKRVRLLNASGKLAKAIEIERVRDPLASLGTAQAMTILKALEDASSGVRDPTAYIRAAVASAGGTVVPDELDGQISDGEEEEEFSRMDSNSDGVVTQEEFKAVRKPMVKSEMGAQRSVKAEAGDSGYGLTGVKAEDLSEAERIERRVGWLNQKGGLSKDIVLEDVLPALDSIGFRQAMRVLRRLEESAASESDPNAFIKDLVGRAGWIWAKPDVIDDDEKVAKRVAWLNQFGGLSQPVDWAQVADALDGLRVPHAMVLLRELEVNASTIADPTQYIMKAVGASGQDNVQVPVVAGDPDSAVAQQVAWLNAHGGLAAPIDANEIGEDLGRINEKDAIQILQEVESKGASLKDPTGYIKFKMKAKLAALGSALEDTVDDSTKILKRIEWLNDYGGLLKDIDYNRVAEPLQSAGIEHAMTVLKELEDKRSSVTNPTSFIMGAVASAAGRAQVHGNTGGVGGAVRRPAGNARKISGDAGDLATLSSLVDLLSRRVKTPVKLTDVAGALDSLGPKAPQVLQEMQEKGLGLDDPVAYIRAAAQRQALTSMKSDDGEDDDVAKLTKRITWLNKFGGLAKPIKTSEVVGALYCLGLPQSMAIMRGLQEKGDSIPDPTKYIKAAVQRANGVLVTPGPRAAKQEPKEEPEEDQDEEDDADDTLMDEALALADDYEEAGDEDDAMDDSEALMAEAALLADGYEDAEAVAPPKKKAKTSAAKRVVGAITGVTKLVPPQATAEKKKGPSPASLVKEEDGDENDGDKQEAPTVSSKASRLPVTPQEKLVQVRNLAVKCGLNLDELCLKNLARLPFYRARDMIDDVLLGGRNRTGVTNPSRYLTLAVQKLAVGLGVEQGIAMELAVSLGVVLNNDALDELASIPRKDSHSIIRMLAKDAESRQDPIGFIQSEVQKIRAQMEATPFGAN